MAKESSTKRSQHSKKILVRIWKPLIKRLNDCAEKACLRRDAFLDHVLLHEAQMLSDEMPPPNSKEGLAALEREFGLLPISPVNLNLSIETFACLDAACESKNVPRNTFVNRVVLLLTMKDEWVAPCFYADFGLDWHELGMELLGEFPDERNVTLWGSTLHAAESLAGIDPFWSIRGRIEIARRVEKDIPALHSARIGRDFFHQFKSGHDFYLRSAEGLNCYLPDVLLDGTAAQIEFEEGGLDIF